VYARWRVYGDQMRYEWGDYAFEGAVTVGRPSVDVLRWLMTPDCMSRWIVGLDAVTLLDSQPDVVGAQTRLDFGPGQLSPGTFRGEVVELSDQTLVRRYRPGFDADKYERTVRYDLRTIGAATGLLCSVRTRPSVRIRPCSAASRPGASGRICTAAWSDCAPWLKGSNARRSCVGSAIRGWHHSLSRPARWPPAIVALRATEGVR
jgi:hypothetical protein